MTTLTDRVIERLPTRPTRYEVTHSGVTIRVTPAGQKILFVRSRSDDREHRERLGEWPACSAATALARAQEITQTAARPVAPPAPRPREEPLTFARFATRFMEEHVNVFCKSKTSQGYELWLRQHVLPILGTKPLAKITRSDIQLMHRTIAAKVDPRTKKPHHTTANRSLTLVGSVFARAVDWEVLEVSPMQRQDNRRGRLRKFPERKIERYLTDEEHDRLEEVLEAHAPRNPGAVLALRLLIMTGARSDEILSLQWADIDWAHKLLRLRDAKTGARDVPVSSEVIKLLRQASRSGTFVCATSAGHKISTLQRTWSLLRRRAGIPDVRKHDLRHNFASTGASTGIPLLTVGKILGHKDVRTTQRYAHLFDQEVKAAVEQIGNRLARRGVQTRRTKPPRSP